MPSGRLLGAALLAAVLLAAAQTSACSLCDTAMISPTFRQEAALAMAKLILHGTIANPRTTGGLTGETDFHIKTVLRTDPLLKDKKTLVLPRYLPVNDKDNPPHYLLFADVDRGKIDPYRGLLIRGTGSVEYLKKALALNPKDAVGNLVFFFRYLDDADPEVSRDAFLEFAKANDADIAAAAPKLDAEKLRGWIKDAKTPQQRLGVYALLLGGCGKDADVRWLRGLLDSKEERYQLAADGLLAGYMQKKPREGWALAEGILGDGRKPLLLRLAVLRTLRFYQGAQPKESRPHVLRSMKTVLLEGELADVAIEDLRRWGIWELTGDILKLYGKKGFESALMRRAIIRYALSSPATPESQAFLKARRADDAENVKDQEEALKFEKGM